MDLSTEYMGLKLKNPIIVSSSKLTSNIDSIKKCADVGAGAIVLKSIFEEQLIADSNVLMDQDIKYFWFPEAIEYINKHSKEFGVRQLLELLKKVKDHTDIPVIASINCFSSHEWPRFARRFEEAGADGIELNIAIFPFDKNISSHDIEDQYIDIVTEVKKHIKLPVAVKLSNYFTNLTQLTHRLDDTGADGLVLFNRLYRPDINIDQETVVPQNLLSAPQEVTKALRWIALLSGKLNCHLAGGTGIHDYQGVVKHLLAGAYAVQICSTLYNHGISYIDTLLSDLEKWMKKHRYNSIEEFRGKICNPEEDCTNKFERIQYIKQEL